MCLAPQLGSNSFGSKNLLSPKSNEEGREVTSLSGVSLIPVSVGVSGWVCVCVCLCVCPRSRGSRASSAPPSFLPSRANRLPLHFNHTHTHTHTQSTPHLSPTPLPPPEWHRALLPTPNPLTGLQDSWEPDDMPTLLSHSFPFSQSVRLILSGCFVRQARQLFAAFWESSQG